MVKKATFAGGCFWCMEPAFKLIKGVSKVASGYTGGKEKNPSYEQVCSGETGHVEAIQVTYDEKKVDYGKLLEVFWTQIDPTDDEGQFADRGSQYKTAIFYHDDEQKKIAKESKKMLEKTGRFAEPIATEIKKASEFYPAEEYHQNYSKKNPVRYKMYRMASGRDQYLNKFWSGK